MDLRRIRRSRHSGAGYELALRDILGAPGRRDVDALALVWGHTMAWSAHRDSHLDEVNLLSLAAERYGLPLSAVLDERTRQLSAPPVVPAARPPKAAEPEAPRRLHRPA